MPLQVLTFHFFFVKLQITSTNDREEIIYFLESNSLILSVTDTNTNDDTYTIIPDKKEEFRHLIKCER